MTPLSPSPTLEGGGRDGGSWRLGLRKCVPQPLQAGRCQTAASQPSPSSGNCFLVYGGCTCLFPLLASVPAADECLPGKGPATKHLGFAG